MRRQYPFHLIEPKWQRLWEAEATFRAWNPGDAVPAQHHFAKRHRLSGKVPADRLPPKFYILDMFPYPSGAGLHVGHPEGYTATDILARYRRACGCNVLHPMGWDAFGLPAEQYAIRTGQHPRKTTEANIAVFWERQIQSLGFSYDWSREIDTTDPKYFKWTQWIFLQLYNSWFNPATGNAEPIDSLPDARRRRGFAGSLAPISRQPPPGLRERSAGLVVRGIGNKSWPTKRGHRRQKRSGRISRRAPSNAPVDASNHGVCRPPPAWPGSTRMERIAQGNAAEIWIGRSEGAEVVFLSPRASKGSRFSRRARTHFLVPLTWFFPPSISFPSRQSPRQSAGPTFLRAQNRGGQEERPGTH